MLLVSLMSLTPDVVAQCGFECFDTPEPSPTGSPTPTPGAGTPTAVPFPPTVDFPNPEYEVPTSIPLPEFPDIPNPEQGIQLTPFDAPSPFAVTITPDAFSTPNSPAPTAIPLDTISSTIALSYTTPLTLDTSLTGTNGMTAVNGIISDVEGLIGDVQSYTIYLSGTIATINPTGTFTIASAPDWYAPDLPRDMADIGWTFETLGQDETQRYSYAQWAWFAGYMAAMPFKLVKILWLFIQFSGPLGLFLVWLLVMLPLVLFVRFFDFIKDVFILLLRIVVKVIEIIGEYAPTGG